MRTTTLRLAASALLLVAGCAGQKAFTRGTYEDPRTVALLDDRFGENDMQLIARTMVGSLTASPSVSGGGKLPAILVGPMRNRTAEHIDMQSLADQVRTALIQSGKVRFVDGTHRTDIAEEYEYQQSGYVDPAQAKGPGYQTGADFLLTGTLTSNVQEVGKDKLVYYKATFRLTGLLTSEVVWSEEREIRKAYRKRSLGL